MHFFDRKQLENLSGLDPEIERQFKMIISGKNAMRGEENEFCPPADMILGPDHLVIVIELAGIKRDDIQLGMGEHELVIRGYRNEPGQIEKDRYLGMEINFGPFTRSFRLPTGLDTEGIQANYSDGFLVIRIPRNPDVPVRLTLEDEQ